MIRPQTQSIGQAGQIVEDPDDMRDLKNRLVVEPEIAERFPIGLHHLRRCGAQLLGDVA